MSRTIVKPIDRESSDQRLIYRMTDGRSSNLPQGRWVRFERSPTLQLHKSELRQGELHRVLDRVAESVKRAASPRVC